MLPADRGRASCRPGTSRSLRVVFGPASKARAPLPAGAHAQRQAATRRVTPSRSGARRADPVGRVVAPGVRRRRTFVPRAAAVAAWSPSSWIPPWRARCSHCSGSRRPSRLRAAHRRPSSGSTTLRSPHDRRLARQGRSAPTRSNVRPLTPPGIRWYSAARRFHPRVTLRHPPG